MHPCHGTAASKQHLLRSHGKKDHINGHIIVRDDVLRCRADVVLVGSEVDIVQEVRSATGDSSDDDDS